MEIVELVDRIRRNFEANHKPSLTGFDALDARGGGVDWKTASTLSSVEFGTRVHEAIERLYAHPAHTDPWRAMLSKALPNTRKYEVEYVNWFGGRVKITVVALDRTDAKQVAEDRLSAGSENNYRKGSVRVVRKLKK